LRIRRGCRHHKAACKSDPYGRGPDPPHDVHPKLFNGPKVPDCRANVNSGRAALCKTCVHARGTRAKQAECGLR
jgi:hypothetical protein